MNSKTVWLYIISAELALSAIVAAAVVFQWYGLGDPPTPYQVSRSTNMNAPSARSFPMQTAPMITSAPSNMPTDSTRSGYATWYSRASARREGTGGKRILMANRKPLRDNALTCALPTKITTALNMKFGQRVHVTNLKTGHTAFLTYTDHGPGQKSRLMGTIIDLTPAAFVALGGKLAHGKITVKIIKED